MGLLHTQSRCWAQLLGRNVLEPAVGPAHRQSVLLVPLRGRGRRGDACAPGRRSDPRARQMRGSAHRLTRLLTSVAVVAALLAGCGSGNAKHQRPAARSPALAPPTSFYEIPSGSVAGPPGTIV